MSIQSTHTLLWILPLLSRREGGDLTTGIVMEVFVSVLSGLVDLAHPLYLWHWPFLLPHLMIIKLAIPSIWACASTSAQICLCFGL